jgi:predicted lipoprotein with Yx(FWY)xxD motif
LLTVSYLASSMGVIEVVAFATLAGLAAMPAERGPAAGRLLDPLDRLRSGVVGASIAAVSVVALAVLGASVAAAGAPAATAPGALKAVRIGGATVLADVNGRTLYWFAPDTAARSACYGSCAVYWPPVKGPATAGPGVTGTLSVLTRSDGSVQAAYNGHPLYTYVGDSAPGQANGNGLNLNGGLWHEVTASG